MAEDLTKGFQEFSEELTELAKSTSEPYRKEALDAGGEIIAGRARQLVPVLKDEHYGRVRGYLRDQGIVKDDNDGNSIQVGWTKDGFYGRFLENGTSKMDPFPHIRPAYEQKKREVWDAMEKKMKLK